MRTIDLVITEKDIENGVPGRVASCPITHAARRLFGVPLFAGRGEIYINDAAESFGTLADTTGKMLEFMNNFDQGYAVAPICFSIVLRDLGEKILSTKEGVA